MKSIKLLLVCSFLIGSQFLTAQCSMCRAVLESGADAKMAEQLNDGAIPTRGHDWIYCLSKVLQKIILLLSDFMMVTNESRWGTQTLLM